MEGRSRLRTAGAIDGGAGAGWKFEGTDEFTRQAFYEFEAWSASTQIVQFAEVRGWNAPTNAALPVVLGDVTYVDALYTFAAPTLEWDWMNGRLMLHATNGAACRLEWTGDLTDQATWTPYWTGTLSGVDQTPITIDTNAPQRFYRAVWIP